MAAEGPPGPSPRTPSAAALRREAAPPAVEAETPRDPSRTPGGAATRQGESCCSEEFVLNRTFAVCDPEQTGTVLAGQVVEYLQALTGQSGEEGQLRALHHMLDPEAAGAALDLPTFHAIMREWIASCQQEGGSRLAEEQDAASGDLSLVLAVGEGRTALAAAQLEGDGGNMDIMSLTSQPPHSTEAAGLRSRAEQLATQNAKLQQDAESAEELNACLAEETAQLKAQLRCSSQQALEQARAAAEELEDLKAVTKGLEEENSELRRQARQLEKEQRHLCLQANSLQEENQQLLAEGHGLRERIQALSAETDNLEDTALTQSGKQVEELMLVLQEYKRAVQELQLETTQLRNQMGQMQDAWAMQPWCPPGEAGDVPAQPLGAEIEATCWVRTGDGGALGRATPAADPPAHGNAQETGDTEEEEEMEEEGTAAPAAPRGDSEEPAKPPQCPCPRERLTLLQVLLVLLVLLGLLCLLPHRWLQLPHGGAAWPQLHLCYWRPPPQ
ncbi:protein KASH5 isoform X2 [Tyto alba]|uniref:protein KASH5 isoform X2 n=1 Tax=Tyto alba TaxID=56313 RepID=UPI001C67C825|nr:protein KASH5 isoform X2 [Tyto alba]